MRAFFEEILNGRTDVALEYYTSALEVLHWGRERWTDVPIKTKGAVFQPTIIRAIKIFRLNAWLKVSVSSVDYRSVLRQLNVFY